MKLIKLDLKKRSDRNKFIDFPFHIYKNNPYWVPVIRSDMNLVMSPLRHPFYQHSIAEFFIVESEREVLGRIAVIKNNPYNSFHKSNTAFFYYFDAIDDNQVADLLFNGAIDWARKQNLNQLLGPKGFCRSNAIGLLIDGFNYLPAMGIPYNFPYYRTLIENTGFSKETDHLSGYLDRSNILPENIHTAAQKVKDKSKFWILELKNNHDIQKWISEVEKIHQKAFSTNPNFIPSSPQEFRMMADSIIRITLPGLIKLIMKENEVVGFIIAYPNINRAIQRNKGRLLPFGWIDSFIEKKKTVLCDLNGVGIIPEYQGLGANILLYSEVEKSLRKFSFERAEIIQVDERNFKSKSDMDNMGIKWYKRHRIYTMSV